MLERTPGITMDRANVGGNQSGQQSGYISRGAVDRQQQVVDRRRRHHRHVGHRRLADLLRLRHARRNAGHDRRRRRHAADRRRRHQPRDASSGTDRFKGSGRFYVTDEKFQADNITDELRAQGAGSGAPIQNIKDYGFEVGGPIKKGSAWFWGSYGTQDIKVGVVGFYKNNADLPSRRRRAQPAHDRHRDAARLSRDRPDHAQQLQLEGHAACRSTNNRFNFQNTWAEKVRNARDASRPAPDRDRPTARRPSTSEFGTFGWITGPDAVLEGRAISTCISDRWLVDVHVVAPRQQLRPRLPRGLRCATCSRAFETTTQRLGRVRSSASIFLRPTNSFDVTSNYFLPATLGGDHAFKFGYRWRIGALDQHQPSRRLHRRALHQRRRRTRRTSGATATRCRTSTPTRSTCRTPTRGTA